MAGKIFVNYRRDDDPSAAARVRDALAAHFGKDSIFIDVDSLIAGQRFDEQLASALSACDVLIAVMGPRWVELLRARTASKEPDYASEEIAAALKRRIVVIPVRVGRSGLLAPLPRREELPAEIRDLVLYQKHDIAHENFARDIKDLINSIAVIRGTAPAKAWGNRLATGAICLLAIAVLILALPWPLHAPKIGPPVPASGASSTAPKTSDHAQETPKPADTTDKQAATDAKAREEEMERLRAAASKAEAERKRIEEEAAKLRAQVDAKKAGDAGTPQANPPNADAGSQKSSESVAGSSRLERKIEKYGADSAWCGVKLEDAVKSAPEVGHGTRVVEAGPNTPCALSGIKADDIILEANGLDLIDSRDFAHFLSFRHGGTVVTLTVLRGGKKQRVAVKLGSLADARNR